MRIAGREIANGTKPYIVAEISGNHAGDIKNAIGLIKAAKAAGADAVKTQCYTADSMTIDHDGPGFIIEDGLWKGRKLYDLYKETCTPPEWHKDLYQAAEDEGITIFSSVFDLAGIDILEKLGCPAYKIASFEAKDPLFRDAVRATKKPVIISTGVMSLRHINAIVSHDANDLCILHCVSEYPTGIENAQLNRLGALMHTSPYVHVGISDHSEGVMIPLMATALGACMIEKHIRLDTVRGEDHEFSLNPDDFATMCDAVHLAYNAMRYSGETTSSPFERSVYVIKDIADGDLFSEENIRVIRPGYGAPPMMYQNLLGEEASQSYKRGDPI